MRWAFLSFYFRCQFEMDMIHNIKIDIGMLAAQPFGFIGQQRGWTP
jgi:hypothetical protein